MKKRHPVIKTIAATLVVTAAISCAEIGLTKSYVPYTMEDLSNTKAYVTELKELEEATYIEFNNTELLEYLNSILESPLTTTNIKEITELKISKPLKNNDFSDLKYFTNLKSITIKNNDVNSTDLKYNKNLDELSLISCNVTNTNQLPNSITHFYLLDSIVKDNLLYLPYELKAFYTIQGGFTNIKPKGNKIIYFKIDSNICSADISFLKDFPRLLSLTINTCPNIRGAKVLTEINDKCEVHLDDYAPIWLDRETLKNIKNLDQENYTDLITETAMLDDIANKLVPDKEISSMDKTKIISNYIVNLLNYSEDIINETERYDIISEELNKSPIKYALNTADDFKEVCINYACLFQALANRAGVDSIQLMGVGHTWNVVENDKLIDLTALDAATIIYNDQAYSIEELLKLDKTIPDYIYLVSNPSKEEYKEVYHFTETKNVDNNIGYVKNNKPFIKVYLSNLLLGLCLVLLFNKIKYAYDQIKYRRLEKEINEEIERLIKK